MPRASSARSWASSTVSATGETVPAALAIGVSGLILIVVCQRVLPRVPGVLVVVVLSILAVGLFGLGERGVSLVGVLPQGFPPLTIPAVGFSDLALLLAGALGIALVSLADTISTATAFAARTGQVVDGNREMVGIGAANIGAGLFQGFPVSTSGSRTAVAQQVGAKSQVTGLVGAAAITLILLLAPGILQQPATADPGRGGDRRIDLTGRHPGHAAALPPAAHRVRAVDRGFHRRRRARRAPRHRRGRRPLDRQCLPSGMVAVPDDPRPGSGSTRIPRRTQLSECRAARRVCDLPVRRTS